MLNSMFRILMILVVISAVQSEPKGGWLGGAEALAAQVFPAPVTATGQTTTYATGDDGALHRGAPWSPSTRFTINGTGNGNGTVTDNLTGLIWLKDANCKDTVGGVAKADGTLTMPLALTWVKALASGACGLSDGSSAGDWRMPNIRELESLLDISQSRPALPAGRPFSNVQGLAQYIYYWSSSYYPIGMGAIWVVDMYDGVTSGSYSQTNPAYVWPVRGGQSGFTSNSVSPASNAFGNVVVGSTSTPQTFTISNSSKANLIVSAITLTGRDSGLFNLVTGNGTAGSCGATPTIAPAGSCTVTVNFAPTSLGIKEATLQIASNDPVTAIKDVALSGISPSPHTISTAVVGGHGSISCSSPVNTGGTSICTITPDSGFSLADIVDNSLDLNNNIDKYKYVINGITYSITNVAADHVVAGTFTHNAVLSAFSMPATTTSLTVPVTTFAASYANGYKITELSIAPDASTSDWYATAPADYTFSAAGDMTAYAWVKDEAGNVSPSISAPVAFPTLQTAYESAAAANVDVHLTTAGSMPANTGTAPEFIADTGKTVSIVGGYNAGNQIQGGVSLVTGSMKIKSGKVAVAGVAIRKP